MWVCLQRAPVLLQLKTKVAATGIKPVLFLNVRDVGSCPGRPTFLGKVPSLSSRSTS